MEKHYSKMGFFNEYINGFVMVSIILMTEALGCNRPSVMEV
jgi:hypothetical protein